MTTTPGARFWTTPVLRAIPAAAAAAVIVFSPNHSTVLGFAVLGSWAVITAVVIAIPVLQGGLPRAAFGAQATALLVGGAAALAAIEQPVAVLLFLTSTLLGVTGGIELVSGIVLRAATGARDWIFTGEVTALTAVVVLLIPADFSQVISIPDKEVPPLTASVIAVGLFGAYCAVVAVYLVIAGLSLKWAADPVPVTRGRR